MFLYYIAVALLLCLAGPFLLLAPKRREGLGQKLGSIPPQLKREAKWEGPSLWFHAVSVGEFNALWPLIQSFASKHSEYRIMISTSTATAQKLARERAGMRFHVFYFPLDLPFAINPWLNFVDPSAVVIAETEIWPGFTHECKKRGIPVVIVNGRISKRSFGSYKRYSFIFGPTIRNFAAIAAQSEIDFERYRAIAGLNIPAEQVGNLKFDGLTPIPEHEVMEIQDELGLLPGQMVVVAGSTHDGEEAAILVAFRKLLQAYKEGKLPEKSGQRRAVPRLILVPRHPERFNQVADLVKTKGFRVRRHSAKESFEEDSDVYMLDTIGKLFRYYSVATIAFVGGTLAPIGGHNLLEPYAYSVPVICGPSLDKALDVAAGLKQRQALTVCDNADSLADKLLSLAMGPEEREELGRKGNIWLKESEGAVDRSLVIVEKVLAGTYNQGRPDGSTQA